MLEGISSPHRRAHDPRRSRLTVTPGELLAPARAPSGCGIESAPLRLISGLRIPRLGPQIPASASATSPPCRRPRLVSGDGFSRATRFYPHLSSGPQTFAGDGDPRRRCGHHRPVPSIRVSTAAAREFLLLKAPRRVLFRASASGCPARPLLRRPQVLLLDEADEQSSTPSCARSAGPQLRAILCGGGAPWSYRQP